MGILGDVLDLPEDAWNSTKRGFRGAPKERPQFDEAPKENPNSAPQSYGGSYTGAGEELGRYRGMGEAASQRQAVQLQYGAANANRAQNLDARGQQIEGNNMLRDAAAGQAPSRAAIEGGQVAGNSLDAALTAGAGARNPALAQARGQMTPEQAATQQQRLTLQGADTATAGRAGELSQARGAYGQSGANMRGGDVALQGLDAAQAEAQGNMEMAQRIRNAKAQQGYEKMGLGVEESEASARLRQDAIRAKQDASARDTADARKAQGRDLVNHVIGWGKKYVEQGSDERMKSPATLKDLSLKARTMREQNDASLDSLKYGPSVGKESGPSDADVDTIRGRTTDEQDDASLLHESRIQQARDDQTHDRRIQEARNDQQTDRSRSMHGEDPEMLQYGHPKQEDVDAIRTRHGEPRATGVGGALQGYAARRTGEGSMFGQREASGADQGPKWDEDNGQAPGSYDALRYGNPTERSEKAQDKYSQAVSTSDAEAKRQAFLDGVAHGAQAPGKASPFAPNEKEEPGVIKRAVRDVLYGKDNPDRTDNKPDVVSVPQLQREQAQPIGEKLQWAKAYPPGQGPPVKHADTSYSPLPPPLPPPPIPRDESEWEQAYPPGKGPPAHRTTVPERSRKVGPVFVPEATSSREAKSPVSLSDESVKEHEGDTTGGSVQDPEMQRDANRQLRGETYKYKEGFGEETARVHHGFMAQNLEKNPITATAVRDDDGTGVKKVDNTDALRVTAAGVAQLQDDNDQMRGELDKLLARRKRA